MKINKIVKYCTIITITLALSIGLAFATATLNDKSSYTPGGPNRVDDTGYTTHLQGWPLGFMEFNTFLSIGTPMRGETHVDYTNLAIDASVFILPSLLVAILLTSLVIRRLESSATKKKR
jgi:hypothetical protein